MKASRRALPSLDDLIEQLRDSGVHVGSREAFRLHRSLGLIDASDVESDAGEQLLELMASALARSHDERQTLERLFSLWMQSAQAYVAHGRPQAKPLIRRASPDAPTTSAPALETVAHPTVRRRAATRSLALGALSVALATAAYLLASPLLVVRSTEFSGTLPPATVLARVSASLDQWRGSSILRLEVDAIHRRLLETPWIAEVRLRRRLPSTLVITLKTRLPAGTIRSGSVPLLIDDEGVVLGTAGVDVSGRDLPLVEGVSVPVDKRQSERWALFTNLVRELRQHRSVPTLATIDLSTPSDAVVSFRDDATRLHLGHAAFAARLQLYQRLAPQLRERLPQTFSVDLRFGRRIYIVSDTRVNQ